MSDFVIKPASRQGINPLIGLYGESGTGKTYSGLLLARGLAGPSGKIVMIDTESGRGSLYADVLPGGYEVIELTEPFAPARYIQALQAAEKSGARVVMIDSASHEWEGQEGVLDQAAANEQRSGKPGLHCWKQPKFEHAKFVSALLRSSVPVIVCLRAKFKSRQGRNAQGKTEIVKDDHPSPIQAEDFIFEMTAHAEILPDHSLRLTKWSHPALKEAFPAKGPITIQTGEAVARWCQGGAAPRPAPKQPESIAQIADLKKQIWDLTMEYHHASKNALNQWLWDENYMVDTETWKELPASRLAEILDKLKSRQPIAA